MPEPTRSIPELTRNIPEPARTVPEQCERTVVLAAVVRQYLDLHVFGERTVLDRERLKVTQLPRSERA